MSGISQASVRGPIVVREEEIEVSLRRAQEVLRKIPLEESVAVIRESREER